MNLSLSVTGLIISPTRNQEYPGSIQCSWYLALPNAFSPSSSVFICVLLSEYNKSEANF